MNTDILLINDIMLQIGNIIKSAKKNGWYSIPYQKEETLEIQYLNYLISLIKDAYAPYYISYLLDCKMYKIMAENQLTTNTIEKLLVIKHLAYTIQLLDWNNFMKFANYSCNGETRDKLNFNI